MTEIKYTGMEFTGSLRMPKPVKWEPQEDITPYELALAMPVLLGAVSPAGWQYIEDSVLALPESVQRHFSIG